MADCSKTADFFKEYKRCCNSMRDKAGWDCLNCPISALCDSMDKEKSEDVLNHVAILQKWSDEHSEELLHALLADIEESIDMS